ncbi:hypothetical protein AMK34_01055 [Amycolatopsis sp. CB00013]|nr:hypothetical protein AMK34_01055 [Amycolatopsis sp. CB00013]
MQRLSQAKTRLTRLQEAIEAGADPGALIEPLNRAKEERDAAEEDLARAPAEESIGRAELEAMVDAFGELGRQVGTVSPEDFRSSTARSAWRWPTTQKSGRSM